MYLEYSILMQPARVERMAAKSLVVGIAEACDGAPVEMRDHNAIATVNQYRLILCLEQQWKRNSRLGRDVELNLNCKLCDGLFDA